MPKVIEASTDIARTPREVFDYLADPARLPEWQPSVEEATAEPPGIPTVGMRGQEIRRGPGGRRTMRWEVTECEPGRRWRLQGIEGPVRAHVSMELTETAQGTATRVDYEIWFESHGIGKLVEVLARHGARKDVPDNLALLKKRLEREPERKH